MMEMTTRSSIRVKPARRRNESKVQGSKVQGSHVRNRVGVPKTCKRVLWTLDVGPWPLDFGNRSLVRMTVPRYQSQSIVKTLQPSRTGLARRAGVARDGRPIRAHRSRIRAPGGHRANARRAQT